MDILHYFLRSILFPLYAVRPMCVCVHWRSCCYRSSNCLIRYSFYMSKLPLIAFKRIVYPLHILLTFLLLLPFCYCYHCPRYSCRSHVILHISNTVDSRKFKPLCFVGGLNFRKVPISKRILNFPF